MAALAKARAITQLGVDVLPPTRAAGVSGDAIIYHGAMVGIASDGYIAPASSSIRAIGIADLEMWNDQASGQQGQVMPTTYPTTGTKIDATGVADGVRKLVVRHGVYKMNNKAGDLLTAASIGGIAYVEDDQTVRLTAGGGKAAGVLMGFADDGLPLVLLTPPIPVA